MRFIGVDVATGQIVETGTSGFGKPDNREDRVFIDATDRLDIGDRGIYNIEDATYAAPASAPRPLSKFEFMSLFTSAERQQIRALTAAGDATLADAFDMLSFAAYVEPSHLLTQQMLGYIQAIGVMDAPRRAAFDAAMTSVSES